MNRFALIIALGVLGSCILRGQGVPSAAANPASPSSSRKLDVTFLFHANQNLVPYGKVGDRACFRGLLTTLRRHPAQKFMIHFSGTLIHDLLWFGDSTLQILRQGIQDGQFEIIGSTYSQNVMYSTRLDTNDFEFNDHQIKIHKEEIQNILGATPVGFWNPERVWTQNFTQLLANNGYKYVQVEDHILQASGATGSIYQVRTTDYNGRQITVFEDDKEYLGLVENAINSHNTSGVISYLNQKYAEDRSDADVIGYYEDAEATGLWQYEGHNDPQLAFAGLDSLLSAIGRDTLINVTTYSEYMHTHAATEHLPRIVDGAAAWMGSDAWFTENQRPEFGTMRAVYDSLRKTLDSVGSVIAGSPSNPSASALLQHAWYTLCAHQFEFGCHGFEEDINHAELQLARTCLISAEAALFALNTASESFSADVNRDGVAEVVLVTPENFYVFSPYGGRLLYWFDLVRGEEMVGNEDFSADYLEPYINDNEALPLIRGGIETYPWLSGNPVIPEILTWTFNVRKRALNDILKIGGGAEQSFANMPCSVSLNGTSVSFSEGNGGVNIRKVITAASNGLTVTYHLQSAMGFTTTFTHRIENALSPSYLDVINGGRRSLSYWDGISGSSQNPTALTVGVRNNMTGNCVKFTWQNTPDQMIGAEDVFALEMNPVYMRTLAPGDSVSYAFSLSAQVDTAFTVEFVKGWNLISLPRIVDDPRKVSVFGPAISNAMMYQGSYQAKDTLANGVGYWLRFASGGSVNVSGKYVGVETLAVSPGWNLIGSLSTPVPSGNIGTMTESLTVTNLFGYSGVYVRRDTIQPGKGYWLKANRAGRIIISSIGLPASVRKLQILPTDELPPTLPGLTQDKAKEIPAEFNLAQNYPNPFNPTTVIAYELPAQSYVTLRIFDVLGREVAMLINGMEQPGNKTATWNAANMPSGVYFYRLTALPTEGGSSTGTFTDVRKVLLMK